MRGGGGQRQLKGQVPLGFAVLKAGTGRDGDEVAAELVAMVRDQIGPVAKLPRGPGGGGPAQDPVGQDVARHDQQDGQRRAVESARHDRGRGRDRRLRRAPDRDGPPPAPA